MFYVISNCRRKFIQWTHKIINHVHIDIKDILSVIITLGNDVNSGKYILFNGMTPNEKDKREHFLKHLNVRCVVGAFDKKLHEVTISTGNRNVFPFILQKYIS